MTFFNKVLSLIFVAVLFIACGGGSGSSGTVNDVSSPAGDVNWQPISTDSFIIGDAQNESFDVPLLNIAYNNARDADGLKSLLVVRNESLVAEAYFENTQVNDLLHERSVTKTMIAMLIGQAIEDGYIMGIEQTIGSFFQADFPELSQSKRNITIAHLLTMTSGFQWDEGQVSGYTNWANSSDPQGFLLNRDLSAVAGEQFNYNSAAVHLLSVILTKATEITTLEYAMEKLFTPLGISQVDWEILNDGYYNGGAGLALRSVDLAKIGSLLLNDGVYQQQMILPSAWVKSAKNHQVNLTSGSSPFAVDGYGYLWWLGQGNTQRMQMAWGWGGQFIATIPDKNMIIIINSAWQVSGTTSREQYAAAFNVMNDVITAAN